MEYFRPDNLAEAYSLFDRFGEEALPVAGTSFFMGHREELFDEVEAVVSLQDVGLRYIKVEDGQLRLGSTTTLADLYSSEITNSGALSIFSETVSKLKIKEVRNVGTVGGEVCICGEVDLPTTLHAMDATVVLGSAEGQTSMPIKDFHLGYLSNALEIGQIVLEVTLPVPPPNTGASFQKFERTATDLPIVNVMGRVTLDKKGRYSDAKIAVGAAVPVPERAFEAEKMMIGHAPSEELIRSTALAVSQEIQSLADHRASAELRSLWVKCAVEDALTTATRRAKGE
ncbi:MAG: FAD binding domain-containing protein [Pseudomonadales bacterium]